MLFSLPSCTGFDTLTVVILYRVTGWPEQLGSRFSNNIQNQTLTTCFFIPFHNLHWTGTSSLPAYLVCVFLFRHYLTLTAEWPEGYLSGGHSYSTEMCWEHSPPLRFLLCPFLNIFSQNMASSLTSAMTENRVATFFVHRGVMNWSKEFVRLMDAHLLTDLRTYVLNIKPTASEAVSTQYMVGYFCNKLPCLVGVHLSLFNYWVLKHRSKLPPCTTDFNPDLFLNTHTR